MEKKTDYWIQKFFVARDTYQNTKATVRELNRRWYVMGITQWAVQITTEKPISHAT